MFIADLLAIATKWKWPAWPPTDEWIMKVWYMYTVEFSVIKKNGTMTFSAKWIDLENITARETKEA